MLILMNFWFLYPWLYRRALRTWRIRAKFDEKGVQALYMHVATALHISINGSLHICPPCYQLLASNQILCQLSESRLPCRHASLALLFARSTGMGLLKQAMRLNVKALWPNQTELKFCRCSNFFSKSSKYSSPWMFFSISALITSNDEIFTTRRVANY